MIYNNDYFTRVNNKIIYAMSHSYTKVTKYLYWIIFNNIIIIWLKMGQNDRFRFCYLVLVCLMISFIFFLFICLCFHSWHGSNQVSCSIMLLQSDMVSHYERLVSKKTWSLSTGLYSSLLSNECTFRKLQFKIRYSQFTIFIESMIQGS